MLLSDEDCRQTTICKRSGRCSYVHSKKAGSGYIEAGCAVRTPEDCRQSENCQKRGACVQRGNECIVPR